MKISKDDFSFCQDESSTLWGGEGAGSSPDDGSDNKKGDAPRLILKTNEHVDVIFDKKLVDTMVECRGETVEEIKALRDVQLAQAVEQLSLYTVANNKLLLVFMLFVMVMTGICVGASVTDLFHGNNTLLEADKTAPGYHDMQMVTDMQIAVSNLQQFVEDDIKKEFKHLADSLTEQHG